MASTLVHDRTYLIRQLDKDLWHGTETQRTADRHNPFGVQVRASSLMEVVDVLFPEGLNSRVHVTIEAFGLTNQKQEKEQTI